MSNNKHKNLKELLWKALVQEFERNLGSWKGNPAYVLYHASGIYVIVYPNGTIKIGMSFHLQHCIRQQIGDSKKCFVFCPFSLEQVRSLVFDTLVQESVDLDLPGLVVIGDWKGKQKYLVRLQVAELFLTCAIVCVLKTVGQHLVQKATENVTAIVKPNTKEHFSTVIMEFADDNPDNGMHCLLTWATIALHLRDMLATSNILQSSMHTQPPSGGFVKSYLLKQLFGPKFATYQNSVLQQSPPVRQFI